MKPINLMEDYNQFASGKRLHGRVLNSDQKVEKLSESVTNQLKNQWRFAGRPGSQALVKLQESNGNKLYLTGYDNDKYAGLDQNDFGYISKERVERAEIVKDWQPMRLDDVRAGYDLVEMDKSTVSSLVSGLKAALTRRTKGRRHSELLNHLNKFHKAQLKHECSDEMLKTPANYMSPIKKAIKKYKGK